ncbi:MAG: Zn-ribbon domain-containing protein [Methanomicrobiales archaeon]
MPHKCTKCGREFDDGSTAILKGCPSCGGKKFLYVREEDRHQDVLDEKPLEEFARDREEHVIEPVEEKKAPVEMYDRIESVRIVGPGSYELNIEKLVESDERVVRIGNEEKYALDIISMSKDRKKKKR